MNFVFAQDCIEGVEVELWDSCYSIEQTQILNLYESDLTGEIPDDIGELVNLVSLILPFNELTGQIPESIGKLENLELLDLRDNQLTGNIPESICLINNNFNYLNISNNFLCPPYPTCIQNDVGT